MSITSTQPGFPDPDPAEPKPIEPNPIEPAIPDGTPEEFPFIEPKQFPIHPDIPTQPIHEPMTEPPFTMSTWRAAGWASD